jgi:hypothetical protein
MNTCTLDRVTFEIVPDESPINPRDGDNLGTMVCWHRRYVLGDAHDYRTPAAFAYEITPDNALLLPLYLLDHSGLAIRTSASSFRASDPAGWDWGQVGYIFVMKAAIREMHGVQRISNRLHNRVLDCLRGEVQAYDQYLRGDVYGYILTDRITGEVLDSCWGFYGDNPHTNGMAEHLPDEYRDAILAYFNQHAA